MHDVSACLPCAPEKKTNRIRREHIVLGEMERQRLQTRHPWKHQEWQRLRQSGAVNGFPLFTSSRNAILGHARGSLHKILAEEA